MRPEPNGSTDQESLAAKRRKKAIVSASLGLFLGAASVVFGAADLAALWPYYGEVLGWGIWLFPCGLVIVWAGRMVFVGKAWWGGWLIFLAGLIDDPLLVLLFLPGVSVALSVYLPLLIGGWPGACFKLALDSQEPQPASA